MCIINLGRHPQSIDVGYTILKLAAKVGQKNIFQNRSYLGGHYYYFKMIFWKWTNKYFILNSYIESHFPTLINYLAKNISHDYQGWYSNYFNYYQIHSLFYISFIDRTKLIPPTLMIYGKEDISFSLSFWKYIFFMIRSRDSRKLMNLTLIEVTWVPWFGNSFFYW